MIVTLPTRSTSTWPFSRTTRSGSLRSGVYTKYALPLSGSRSSGVTAVAVPTTIGHLSALNCSSVHALLLFTTSRRALSESGSVTWTDLLLALPFGIVSVTSSGVRLPLVSLPLAPTFSDIVGLYLSEAQPPLWKRLETAATSLASEPIQPSTFCGAQLVGLNSEAGAIDVDRHRPHLQRDPPEDRRGTDRDDSQRRGVAVDEDRRAHHDRAEIERTGDRRDDDREAERSALVRTGDVGPARRARAGARRRPASVVTDPIREPSPQLPALAAASAQRSAEAILASRPFGNVIEMSRRYSSSPARPKLTTSGESAPAPGLIVPAEKPGVNAWPGQAEPAPSPLVTMNASVTVAMPCRLYGVSCAVAVTGPQVRGFDNGARGPSLKLSFSWLNRQLRVVQERRLQLTGDRVGIDVARQLHRQRRCPRRRCTAPAAAGRSAGSGRRSRSSAPPAAACRCSRCRSSKRRGRRAERVVAETDLRRACMPAGRRPSDGLTTTPAGSVTTASFSAEEATPAGSSFCAKLETDVVAGRRGRARRARADRHRGIERHAVATGDRRSPGPPRPSPSDRGSATSGPRFSSSAAGCRASGW